MGSLIILKLFVGTKKGKKHNKSYSTLFITTISKTQHVVNEMIIINTFLIGFVLQ